VTLPARVPAQGCGEYIGTMSIVKVPYFIGEPMPGFEVPEPHLTITPDLPDGSPQERMAVLYDRLAATVAEIDHPIVYSGDCVSIIGVLAGLGRKGIHPILLFFDAHGDFHTWETTTSGFLGGMPLAMVTGRGEQTIMDGAGLTPLPEDRVVLVDARDLDPGEDTAVAESGIGRATVEDIIHIIPPHDPIYVHVDMDVVDPVEMPAMNYPAPDGRGGAQGHDPPRGHRAGRRVLGLVVESRTPGRRRRRRRRRANRRALPRRGVTVRSAWTMRGDAPARTPRPVT
jgi:arginase